MDELEVLREALDYLENCHENTFPDYDGRVMKVFGLLDDSNYQSNFDKLREDNIETMSLKEIATMYTFIVRGERFCDGHIGYYVESGRLLRLVKRHIELLENPEPKRFSIREFLSGLFHSKKQAGRGRYDA